MILEKYSIGIGDRFCRQAKAQLAALIKAKQQGINITPVWNKSHREHVIVGTTPCDTRTEAAAAVKACNWTDPYFVDADHIGLKNVGDFIEPSDFFTLDVADFIGQSADEDEIRTFTDKHKKYIGSLAIPGTDQTFEITAEQLEVIARKFLLAVTEASRIYQHIASSKDPAAFITEVSMDETDQPQSPVEMFFILAAIADKGIPAQTIAPKFTGRFNKGVDYVGDVAQFAQEFEQDIAVINFAIKEFGLAANLKLSVHSGSDKFSIYGPINKALNKFDAGLHLKTAGTTWLEELIALATAGGQGLDIAKEIYIQALARFDELCAPYATVVDIDMNELPDSKVVKNWDSQSFTSALTHDLSSSQYNLSFRQLLHVAYKIAAEMGERYYNALAEYEDIIAPNVTDNIYRRHIKPLFMKTPAG